jgi:hypothetical protein
MARRQRIVYSSSSTIVTAAVGDVDQGNVLDMVAPSEGAQVDHWSLTTKTAGATTGTFTGQLKDGTTTLTAANITVDADAAAGVVHGTGTGNGGACIAAGNRITLTTLKTGTVSTGAVLLVYVAWST